jgi:hypothetical protein
MLPPQDSMRTVAALAHALARAAMQYALMPALAYLAAQLSGLPMGLSAWWVLSWGSALADGLQAWTSGSAG